jgi:hypothetical protein
MRENNRSETKNADKQSWAASLPSRRDVLKVSLAGLTLAATGRHIARRHLGEQLKEVYGDLDNPNYRVREDLGFISAPSYREILRGRLENLDISKEDQTYLCERMDKCTAALSKLPDLLQQESEAGKKAPVKSAEAVDREIDSILRGDVAQVAPPESPAHQLLGMVHRETLEISKLLDNAEVRILSGTGEALLRSMAVKIATAELSLRSHQELVNDYGTPESYVRKLIKEVTGMSLPENVHFTIRSIDKPNTVGTSNAVTQSIISEDNYYGQVVLVLAHEAGHLMTQHDEEYHLQGSRRLSDEQVSNYEEACAYAFQKVAGEALKETPLSMAYDIDTGTSTLLDDFYNGRDSEECHRVGMAYYDAARTVLGGSAQAYNYLSSHRELTPEMLKVIDDNRALTKQIDAETQANRPRLNATKERCAQLLSAVKDAHQQILEPAAAEPEVGP